MGRSAKEAALAGVQLGPVTTHARQHARAIARTVDLSPNRTNGKSD